MELSKTSSDHLLFIKWFEAFNFIETEIKTNISEVVVGIIDQGGIFSKEDENEVIAFHKDLETNFDNKKKVIDFFCISSGQHNNANLKCDASHGTKVAGIIASNNKLCYVGVCPQAKLIAVDFFLPSERTENDDFILREFFRWITGIEKNTAKSTYKYGDNYCEYPELVKENSKVIGADVINCSWGIKDTKGYVTTAIDDVTSYGRKGLGSIVCISSGNENTDITKSPLGILANYPKTIVVSAVMNVDNISFVRWLNIQIEDVLEGSNYGQTIDICAPMVSLTNSIPYDATTAICDTPLTITSSVNTNNIRIIVNDASNLYIGCIVCIGEKENKIVMQINDNEILLDSPIKNTYAQGTKVEYYSIGENTLLEFFTGEGESNEQMIYIKKNKFNVFSLKKIVCENSGISSLHSVYKISNFIDDYIKIELFPSVRLSENSKLYPVIGNYTFFSGTSAATPIVTGVAALMLSVNPNLNWLEVRKILRDTATKDNLKDSKDGISYFKDGFCQAYGYGMVDAFEAVKAAKDYIKYDLWIKRSEGEGDVGTNLDGTVELNVPDSDLNCSPHTINTKISNIGAANSIEGAEIRYLIRFSDLSNPAFEFPDAWMENQIDSFLIGNSEIGVIQSGKTLEIKQEVVTQTIGEKKIGIEKVLRKCPADKHPYLLVHITPFDYGVTGNSVRTNNNLAYKRDVFLNAEFLQGDGTTRLPNSLPKSETPVPFKINVKMFHKTGALKLNGIELKVNCFIKKNQEKKDCEYTSIYDGDSSWTGAEQNNIVTDISTEVVDRNAQDKVTEVVISGNIHISELYKKLQITVTVPNCLNECTHEIRRKSAVFSKFTSALVEDMEFREKIYFFTDCDNLSNTKKYGAISSGDTDFQTGFDRYRITNVFAVEGTQETNSENGTETTNETNSETSTPHKAYAVCKGKILVQEDKDDASLVNIVLKPEMHSSNNPAVKYFVYRGILKSSLYEDDNVVKNNGNSVVSWIEKNIEEPDKRILGVELTDDVMYSNTAPIDNAFYNPKGGFELLTVPAGWCIGTFADNYIGFEIWLDTIGFNPTFSMIRNHETIIAVEQLPMNPTDGDISAHKAQKEQILNYMDPAAYFGNLYDDRIFVRNTNSEASRDGIEYSFEKVKKENLYTQIIDKFLNKNVVYIDIRNEFNTSYNYFGNYGEIKLDVIRDKEQQPTTEVCYEGSNWPIIATTFTPSFDDGVVKMAFKKGDNETPLAYVAIGERGRTLAEKIAQGKTNFVDLTAENDDYTDNFVAMVVPFRTNTAPNMENTYISVASYMRIDYLRRMKPTTPNNQETQEPQEQQEPQTPENTENLPVWKQRESSADLLFRPMDMQLPIENVTEGFVVKVYEDEVYIDVPEHQIDYMARMGIARDPDNTYLFAVKSDLHTKNAFQMSNPRFSICSGVNKITKDQFMKYVFGGNYTKKEVQFKDGTAYIVSYQSPILNDFMSNSNEIDMNREAELLVISNENYNKLLEKIHNGGFGENSIVYISLKKKECENYNEYTLSLQEVRPSGVEEPSEPLLAIEIMKVLGDKA